MVLSMILRPRRPAGGQQPMIPIWQVESAVVLDEKIEKDRDEEGASERVGGDGVQGDVGGGEEGHPFGYAESVGDVER